MHTTSGLLIYLQQRLGSSGGPMLLALAVALAVLTLVLAFVAAELIAAAPEPILTAPVRWGASLR